MPAPLATSCWLSPRSPRRRRTFSVRCRVSMIALRSESNDLYEARTQRSRTVGPARTWCRFGRLRLGWPSNAVMRGSRTSRTDVPPDREEHRPTGSASLHRHQHLRAATCPIEVRRRVRECPRGPCDHTAPAGRQDGAEVGREHLVDAGGPLHLRDPRREEYDLMPLRSERLPQVPALWIPLALPAKNSAPGRVDERQAAARAPRASGPNVTVRSSGSPA
jgi:hypothetical protein